MPLFHLFHLRRHAADDAFFAVALLIDFSLLLLYLFFMFDALRYCLYAFAAIFHYFRAF